MQKINKAAYDCCVTISISGRVQGVGFRFFTYQEAQKLNLIGYVMNLDNGKVKIVACGNQIQINKLIDWVKAGGPDSAKIENYEIQYTNDYPNFTNFSVRY